MKITGPKTSARWNETEMTYIGAVNGVSFYEHPTQGDEAPLVIFQANISRWVITDFWEVPGIEELGEFEKV